MPMLRVQVLLGHSSLDMDKHYAQMVDHYLLQAYEAHGPIDCLSKLRKYLRGLATNYGGPTWIQLPQRSSLTRKTWLPRLTVPPEGPRFFAMMSPFRVVVSQ